MNKTINCHEFKNAEEHLFYWSNSAGELHGEDCTLTPDELPDEMRQAYYNLLKGGGNDQINEYLVEYDGKYYVSIEYAFDEFILEETDSKMTTIQEFYENVKKSAMKLLYKDLFADVIMIFHEETSSVIYYEFCFLVPASYPVETFKKIENILRANWTVQLFSAL